MAVTCVGESVGTGESHTFAESKSWSVAVAILESAISTQIGDTGSFFPS